jgi:hypothetical protein
LFWPWAASAVEESWGSAFMMRIIPYLFSRANIFYHELQPRTHTNGRELQKKPDGRRFTQLKSERVPEGVGTHPS